MQKMHTRAHAQVAKLLLHHRLIPASASPAQASLQPHVPAIPIPSQSSLGLTKPKQPCSSASFNNKIRIQTRCQLTTGLSGSLAPARGPTSLLLRDAPPLRAASTSRRRSSGTTLTMPSSSSSSSPAAATAPCTEIRTGSKQRTL
jgi:hypothetical protein